MEVKLQQANNTDIPFLHLLRTRTMNEYLQASGIATDRQSQTERIQYHFDDAKIIYHNDKPIGLFKFYFNDSVWHVTQLQILAEYQGKGVGSKLLTNLLKKADDNNHSVRLSVLKSNPAKYLYQKLGFIVVAESDCEYTMQYAADKTHNGTASN